MLGSVNGEKKNLMVRRYWLVRMVGDVRREGEDERRWKIIKNLRVCR